MNFLKILIFFLKILNFLINLARDLRANLLNFLKFFFKFLEIILKFLNFFLKILNFLIFLARDLRAKFLNFLKFFLNFLKFILKFLEIILKFLIFFLNFLKMKLKTPTNPVVRRPSLAGRTSQPRDPWDFGRFAASISWNFLCSAHTLQAMLKASSIWL